MLIRESIPTCLKTYPKRRRHDGKALFRMSALQSLVIVFCLLLGLLNMKIQLSHFWQLDVSTSSCRCVDCEEDTLCGQFWKGGEKSLVPSLSIEREKIVIVVSHCLHDLYWLENLTRGTHISQLFVFSKCGADVLGLPFWDSIRIIRLQNVGRCDHSYAHFIANLGSSTDYDTVFFLKDDRTDESIHCDGQWRSVTSMLKTAARKGFACGMRPSHSKEISADLSAYHVSTILKSFSMFSYSNRAVLYSNLSQSRFESPFHNLGEWLHFIGGALPEPLSEVCYGGTFAARKSSITSQNIRIWKNIEKSLSRGNSIQEGHYAERIWAGLLSRPADLTKVHALLDYSNGVANISISYVGTLAHVIGDPMEGWKSSLITKSDFIDMDDFRYFSVGAITIPKILNFRTASRE